MKRFLLVVILVIVTTPVASFTREKGINNKTCSVIDCPAGTKAMTYASKDDPYYSCPSKELSEYSNLIIGLTFMAVQFDGKTPNISGKTGEPEFQGETKQMIDAYRNRAGVATFAQAVKQCKKGANKLKVVVLSDPEEAESSYVIIEKNNNTYWMPKSHLDMREEGRDQVFVKNESD